MQLEFFGTGTSQGVPFVGCTSPACLSKDPKDNRLRTSAMLTGDDGKKILIDCGPDFRQQMLRAGESRVDAVLLTHEHTDHIIGLDDLRPVIFAQGKPMGIYALPRVLEAVQQRFPYAFAEDRYPGAPSFQLHPLAETFYLGTTRIEPLEVLHYRLPIVGFHFGNLAYITDASDLPPATLNKLQGIEHLVLNCLRISPMHISHFVLPQVIDLFEKLKPKNMYLTHISHEFGLHEKANEALPKGIQLAYDGLVLNF